MRMTDDQIASLNQRLQQLGFATMGDYARALTEGVVGNEQLVEALADRVVNKMLTVQPLPSDAAHAMKRKFNQDRQKFNFVAENVPTFITPNGRFALQPGTW